MMTQTQADISFYLALGIDPDKEDVLALSSKEIARAYRRAALKWHPDKNIGDPLAAGRFSRIFLAYETLSDPEKRKLYDEKIRAERLRRKRYHQLDAERKKLRDDLELRENVAESPASTDASIDEATMERIQAEIERLRKEALTEDLHPVKSARTGRESTKRDHHVITGDWANVSGYSAFCVSSNVSFESFEEAILNKRSPF